MRRDRCQQSPTVTTRRCPLRILAPMSRPTFRVFSSRTSQRGSEQLADLRTALATQRIEARRGSSLARARAHIALEAIALGLGRACELIPRTAIVEAGAPFNKAATAAADSDPGQ